MQTHLVLAVVKMNLPEEAAEDKEKWLLDLWTDFIGSQIKDEELVDIDVVLL